MLIKVEFASFAVDPGKNIPLIVLKEVSGIRMLPIPIGPLEASAIAIETLKVTPEKPLTIDVAKRIVDELGGAVVRVILHQEPHGSIMAWLELAGRGTVRKIDCRPCDAVALALRCEAPLFVQEAVLERFASVSECSERDNLRRHIAAIDTLDFGSSYLE